MRFPLSLTGVCINGIVKTQMSGVRKKCHNISPDIKKIQKKAWRETHPHTECCKRCSPYMKYISACIWEQRAVVVLHGFTTMVYFCVNASPAASPLFSDWGPLPFRSCQQLHNSAIMKLLSKAGKYYPTVLLHSDWVIYYLLMEELSSVVAAWTVDMITNHLNLYS